MKTKTSKVAYAVSTDLGACQTLEVKANDKQCYNIVD